MAKQIIVEEEWVSQSIVDSSHLVTFLISILVIVYGSFRSLNMEQDKSNSQRSDRINDQNVQTLSVAQALFIPAAASVSLLLMFFFFESIQTIFLICTAILATIAFSFLLLPMCKYIVKNLINSERTKVSCCIFGKFTIPEIVSFSISIFIVSLWLCTGHWLMMDFLGMGFCVTFIAIVRLPSLKVSTLLLVGLVVYDIFWVYCSQFIFSTNVMIKVATSEANNPLGGLARRFNFQNDKDSYKVALPGKLVVPSYQKGNFSMLGLGDIVMPGLLLCFVLRFDAYKRSQLSQIINGTPPIQNSQSCPLLGSSSNDSNDTETPPTSSPTTTTHWNRLTYFHCSLIGYLVGLVTATLSSEIFKAAQPALLYLVPFTLLPLLIMAYLKGDLKKMWNEPFTYTNNVKYIDV